MADNTQKVGIQVEVNGVEKTFNSIKDLKEEIKNLQNVAESSDIGSEQYKQAVEGLDVLNEKIKEVSQTQKQATKATEDMARAEKEAVKETQDLRKQFEVLEDQLFLLAGQGKQNTKEFRDLTIEAAALNKKIDAVNSSLGENAAGRASAGFSQLKDGFQNLDFDSIKKGFSAVKTAMAATGIMLIVQLVGYLVENFDSLSQGSGILAKYLRFVGDVIGTIVEKGTQLLNFLTDTIGLTTESSRAIEAQGEAFVEASEKSKEAISSQSAEFDRLITVAKASGKSTVDLEIAKQQAIINTNRALLQQALDYIKQGGVVTEEQKKLINEQIAAVKTASTQIEVIKATEAKRVADKNLEIQKKHSDDLLKEQERFNKEKIRLKEELEQKQTESELAAAKFRATALAEQDAINNESTRIAMDDMSEEELQIAAKKAQANRDLAEREKEGAKLLEQEKFAIALNGLNAVQQVSDVFFAFKSSKLKKGSAEELELAKKAFNVNKALQIATATVSGFQAVQSAFTTAMLSPITTVFPAYPFIQAGLAGVFSAASIAKIAASKFEGGGGAPSTGGSPSSGGASIPAPPTISNQNANVEGTQFDENGRRIGSKNDNTINVVATVGVDEITAKTNRVNVLEKQSTF